MYYLRSRAAADAIKFTVDTSMLKVIIAIISSSHHLLFNFPNLKELYYVLSQEKTKAAVDDETKMAQMVCSLTNREECMACGS